MADPIKVEPMATVPVTIIGGPGDGRSPSLAGTIATTPGQQPNLLIVVVTPVRAILIRFANVFLAQLVGLLVAGMTPAGAKLLYTGDFLHLAMVCASLALPGAALGMIKDCVTVFSGLEKRYPLATGSV